jgi:hypothetical protein
MSPLIGLILLEAHLAGEEVIVVRSSSSFFFKMDFILNHVWTRISIGGTHVRMQVPVESKRRHQGATVTGATQHRFWDLNSSSLKKQYTFLNL